MIIIRRGRPREMGRRTSDTDDLLHSLLGGRASMSVRGQGPWRPPIDVFETDDAIEIVAEIAGMDREHIDITLAGDIVSIRGHRPDATTCDHRSFHEARIPYGAFAADVFLPQAIDSDGASAEYNNGFLKVRLPKSRGRTIIPTSGGQTFPSLTSNDADRSDA